MARPRTITIPILPWAEGKVIQVLADDNVLAEYDPSEPDYVLTVEPGVGDTGKERRDLDGKRKVVLNVQSSRVKLNGRFRPGKGIVFNPTVE